MRGCLAAVVFASSILPAYPHRGALTKGSCGDDFGSSSTSLAIADPTISWSFKHYFDCTHRAVWMNFKNPKADFKFYVGVGVPPLNRFKDLRADAVIVGPGLPKFSASDLANIPDVVKNDPAFKAADGGYLHRSPADQSTCKHLGTVMQGHSTVKNGRCDFFETFGRTNSWRVLDGDENNIPTKDGTYHVAVWLQKRTTGKIGIAFGTWVENFWKPFNIHEPTCKRDMADFSEKGGEQAAKFPMIECKAGVSKPASPNSASAKKCTLGEVCASHCMPSGFKLSMGCGAEKCPEAGKLWDKANMDMHKGMAINFTGDADVDFVRGMIPHHQGAVDMCKVLVYNLSCKTWADADQLDGMVHFCNHVNLEQERELKGMRAWLKQKNLKETHTCKEESGHKNHGGSGAMNHGGSGAMNHGGRRATASHSHDMNDGCGKTTAASSKKFIDMNRKMHGGMAIKFSCDHKLDFVRGMIPHHAGAVGMCEVLTEYTSSKPDAYLTELCSNITRLQRAEIAWMSKWLSSRKFDVLASCTACKNGGSVPQPSMPCDDMLPSTSFCHRLGGDLNCKCKSAVAQYSCDGTHEIKGFGTLNTTEECKRTCGRCPDKRPPLFASTSCTGGNPYGSTLSKGQSSYGNAGLSMQHVILLWTSLLSLQVLLQPC